MTLEEEVFLRMRPRADKLAQAGFVPVSGGFAATGDLLSGDFRATLTLGEDGALTGSVLDVMNGEEYAPLRVESIDNAYVNKVRDAYRDWLKGIAAACFRTVPFPADQSNRIAGEIERRFGILPDFPWTKEIYRSAGVFRHPDNQKWFALVMPVKRKAVLKNDDTSLVDVMNVKTDLARKEELLTVPGIYPPYHMGGKGWISMTLDETLSDETVMELIQLSFDLTK